MHPRISMMATQIGVELTMPVSSEAEVFLKEMDNWMSRCQMKDRIYELVNKDMKEKKFSTSLFKGSLEVCPKMLMGDDSSVKKMRFVWKAGLASLVKKMFHERMVRKCKKLQTQDDTMSEHDDSKAKTTLSLEFEAVGDFAPNFF